jgi:hypothetical protein
MYIAQYNILLKVALNTIHLNINLYEQLIFMLPEIFYNLTTSVVIGTDCILNTTYMVLMKNVRAHRKWPLWDVSSSWDAGRFQPLVTLMPYSYLM